MRQTLRRRSVRLPRRSVHLEDLSLTRVMRVASAARTSITGCGASISATRPTIPRRRRSAARWSSSSRRGRAGHRFKPAQGSAAGRAPYPQGCDASRRSRSFINPQRYEYHVSDRRLFRVERARHARAPAHGGRCGRERKRQRCTVFRSLTMLGSVQPSEAHSSIARELTEGSRRLIVLGALAQRDPAFADLRLSLPRWPRSPVRPRLLAGRRQRRRARASPVSCRVARLVDEPYSRQVSMLPKCLPHD